jgi:uncharacterized membrane protein YsdA (DUF1294 family)
MAEQVAEQQLFSAELWGGKTGSCFTMAIKYNKV